MIKWAPFSPKALDFLDNANARLNILHGSVRSSKTINCTVKWLDYLRTGPEGDLAMLGRTMATLKRNVLNDLFDIVGPSNFHWVDRQQGELSLMGRRVYCFGANNEDAESKIRGATFAGAYCDEVTLYPKSVFNQLMARMSVKDAKCFANTNPDSPFHWFYLDYITNEAIKDKKIWSFKMEDNLSLDPDYVKSLKQMYTGVWYDRFIEGLWVAAEGRIYDMYDPDIHCNINARQEIFKSEIHPNAIKWLVGCDYGTSTVMTWGLYAKFPDGKVLKVKEYYYDAVARGIQKTDGQFADEFVKWLDGTYPQIVYCDPSAASWKTELMFRGFNVQNANNDVINGIRYVGEQLNSKNFLMDKSCVNTNAEYSSYVWDAKAQAQGRDRPLKQHDHTCDCDRYVLYTDSLFGASGVYN
nr:MAG TPA: large terminase [Caudoviricetes sp.]